jgi:predicted deacetylase
MLATTGQRSQAERTSIGGGVAIALHDVEPRTFERCRKLREWLARRGVDAVTLLVTPAPDLHPFAARSPALAGWLRARTAAGDAIAQHGLAQRSTRTPFDPDGFRAIGRRRRAEFDGLDRAVAEARVNTGLRLLRDLELDPAGFVAPAYAYTQPLREVLLERFEWFADGQSVMRAGRPSLQSAARRPPAHGAWRRMQTTGSLAGIVRIDVRPSDLGSARRLATLDGLLARVIDRSAPGARFAVTYDELARWSLRSV